MKLRFIHCMQGPRWLIRTLDAPDDYETEKYPRWIYRFWRRINGLPCED